MSLRATYNLYVLILPNFNGVLLRISFKKASQVDDAGLRNPPEQTENALLFSLFRRVSLSFQLKTTGIHIRSWKQCAGRILSYSETIETSPYPTLEKTGSMQFCDRTIAVQYRKRTYPSGTLLEALEITRKIPWFHSIP